MHLSFYLQGPNLVIKRRGVLEESLIEEEDNLHVLDLHDRERHDGCAFMITPKHMEVKIERVENSNKFIIEILEPDNTKEETLKEIKLGLSEVLEQLRSL